MIHKEHENRVAVAEVPSANEELHDHSGVREGLGYAAVELTGGVTDAQIRRIDQENEDYFHEMTDRYDDFWALYIDESFGRRIGHGAHGIVYAFEQDGKEYAAKHGGIDASIVEAFRRAQHIQNVSHLEAVNLEENVAVMDLVPGKRTDEMMLEEKLEIPDSQLSKLIDTVLEMHRVNLEVDFTESNNILYDNDRGFTVIDYYLARRDFDGERSAEQILDLVGVFTVSAVDHDAARSTVGYMLKQEALKVHLMNRFLDILEAEHPEILRRAAGAQQRKNENPNTDRGGRVYDIYTLPHGDSFDSFGKRIRDLGLEGRKPDASLDEALEWERSRYS